MFIKIMMSQNEIIILKALEPAFMVEWKYKPV